jgi:chromosomal replication initiator protein
VVDTKSIGANVETKTPDLYTGEPPLTSAIATWKKVQSDLSYAIGANVHRSWTAQLSVADANEREVVLTAPTRFIASKIRSDYFDTLCRLWLKHDEVAPPRKVKLAGPIQKQETPRAPIRPPSSRKRSVEEKMRPNAHHKDRSYNDGAHQTCVHTETMALSPSPLLAGEARRSGLSAAERAQTGQRYSFDNFVTGPANQFACSALQQVTHQERVMYNPIVIYGKNGSGKTHLLFALKNKVEQLDEMSRVNFISAEQFVCDFVGSLRGKEGSRTAIEQFKAALRNVDALIIDDAHFIVSKPASHDELLQTLIEMISRETQVIMAMDRHPDELEKASPRLKSYLRSGLVCGIEDVDYNLRLRIVDGFIADRHELGQPMPAFPRIVRECLAARVKGTPRDLEGEFNRIVARADMTEVAITIELVESSLADTRFNESLRLTMDRIQRVVCEEFSLDLNDMVSKRRAQIVARPRQVAMSLCKSLTRKSLPEIGRKFGGRDHTTVLHAVKRIAELRAQDPDLDARIKQIEHILKPDHIEPLYWRKSTEPRHHLP